MKLLKNKYCLLVIFSAITGFSGFSQDSTATAAEPEEKPAREMILGLGYFLPVNNVPYLKVSVNEKVERKLIPLKDINANVYLNEESETGLLGKIITDRKGEGKIFITPAFKPVWDSASAFTFIAVTEANKDFESVKNEIQVTKARLEIDTSSDEESRNVTVKVTELKDGNWVAAPDVELKIAVKRSLANLPIGEDETYTTDSTGIAVGEFLRDTIFGDSKGNIVLIARTEDHESYGNLFIEKTVPWGVTVTPKKNFFERRTLWSTGINTPLWLLLMAVSIIIGVWGTLIYLISRLIKIIKIGKAEDRILSQRKQEQVL